MSRPTEQKLTMGAAYSAAPRALRDVLGGGQDARVEAYRLAALALDLRERGLTYSGILIVLGACEGVDCLSADALRAWLRRLGAARDESRVRA